MISVYNAFPNESLLILNKQVLLKIIPEIINDLNKFTESQVASNIENYISNELIPNIEMNTQPEYMSIESRKMYQDTSNVPLNVRNIKNIDTSNVEPKDLFLENQENKEILEQKKTDELNSNNEILEITSEIYNKTAKRINYTFEFIFTVDTANRDLVNQNNSETVNTNYETNSTIIVKFNQKSTGILSDIHIFGTSFKNIIALELVNITIPNTFVNNDTDMKNKYGVKENSPLIVVKSDGETLWKTHPFLLLEIEQLSTNLYSTTSNGGRYFCKLAKPSSNGTHINLKIIGGKKIFRRTELVDLKQMNINILDSRGNKCILGYGAIDIFDIPQTTPPTAIGTSVNYAQNISMDFRVTRLESDLEENNFNLI